MSMMKTYENITRRTARAHIIKTEMENYKLTNKSFMGVPGYHHSEVLNICEIIARGVVSTASDIDALEAAIAAGWKFAVGNYEVTAA